MDDKVRTDYRMGVGDWMEEGRGGKTGATVI